MDVKKRKDREILKIEGPITICRIGELKERFMNSLEKNEVTDLDVMDVQECDSSGVQLLLSAIRSARETGKRINISGQSKAVEDALFRAGIKPEMIIY